MSKNKQLSVSCMIFIIVSIVFLLCETSDVKAMSVKDIGIPTDIKGEISFISKPDYPEGSSYSIVNLNIRQSPSIHSKIVGKYRKSDKVFVKEKINEEWVKTDKGFVWGGYLADTYNVDLNISACSSEASKYVGRVYDVINCLEDKYKNILSKYNIFISENISNDFKYNREDNNNHLAGMTRLTYSNQIIQRDMYIQGSFGENKLKDIIYHELGHALDFENYENMLSESNIIKESEINEKKDMINIFNLNEEFVMSRKEYFAEAFRLSFKDPECLESCAPRIFNYIESIKEDIGN